MTKYTEKERRGMTFAFKAAKKYIESGSEYYICYALRRTRLKYYWLAKEEILDRISPIFSLDSWVYENVTGNTPSADQMKAYRLRWLDHLIEEFSSKE